MCQEIKIEMPHVNIARHHIISNVPLKRTSKRSTCFVYRLCYRSTSLVYKVWSARKLLPLS